MELRSRLLPCRKREINLGLWSTEELTNAWPNTQRRTQTHSFQRSGTWCGVTCCDKTTGLIHTNFTIIFVDNHADYQRKWNDIPAVGHIDEESSKISKQMTRPQRHQSHPRENDGGIEMSCLRFIVITLTHQSGRNKSVEYLQ